MDFITLLKAAILGLIEGITEFLPVSSTGHLILVENLLRISDRPKFVAAFEVIIQLGAILSVIVYFWPRLWPFSGSRAEQKSKWRLWFKVMAAVAPAVIFGVLLDRFIEEKLFNPLTVSVTLIVYGIVLLIVETANRGKTDFKFSGLDRVGYGTAVLVGFFQCLAMVPGTSRSAATIIGGMLAGMSRAVAAEFSFFLAIPTIAGASVLKVAKSGLGFSAGEWGLIVTGFLVSFLVALGVIKVFMSYIQRHDFKLFGYYRIFLGLLVLGLLIG